MVSIAIDQFQNAPLDALKKVEAGETVVILRDNIPVAELKPAAQPPVPSTALRPFGLARGLITISDDFDAPLPDEELKLFEGGMRLLLDTHIFIWFIMGEESRLHPVHLRAIRNPQNTVFLSAAAYWECIVKYRLGKLTLPPSPEIALPALRQQHNIATLDIDEKSVSRLANLPLIHKDPFDRIMICQALEYELIFVTVDEIILTYSVPLLLTTE